MVTLLVNEDESLISYCINIRVYLSSVSPTPSSYCSPPYGHSWPGLSSPRAQLGAESRYLGWAAAVTTNITADYKRTENTRSSSHIKVWPVNMSETERRNTELLLADRLSFVFGLLVIILGEYLILREPQLFTYFYTVLLTVLVAKRYQNIKVYSCFKHLSSDILNSRQRSVSCSCWISAMLSTSPH